MSLPPASSGLEVKNNWKISAKKLCLLGRVCTIIGFKMLFKLHPDD